MSTYIGHWVNWSHGAILGSTITLSSRDGGLLISFLAIFVSVAGAAFWSIVSFSLHQIFANKNRQNGVHQQRQVVLRNSSSPASTAWDLLHMSWAWRKTANRSYLRTLPLAAFAVLSMTLYTLAGVLSSQVTRMPGEEILIISNSCGTFSGGLDDVVQDGIQWRTKAVNDTKPALNYARDCYGFTRDPSYCNQYVQQRLLWDLKQDAACLFTERICIGDNGAYAMDTGLIDSHHHLGINTRQSERLSYRRVTTCSPIKTESYTELVNLTEPGATSHGVKDLVQFVNYGPTAGLNPTYQYNTFNAHTDSSYRLTSFVAFGGTNIRVWQPIPALERTDADVSLFLLAPNGVKFSTPVEDPFFKASSPMVIEGYLTNATRTLYRPDSFVYALACTDQHQYCAAKDRCTPLTASLTAVNASHHLNLNSMQEAIRDRLAAITLMEFMYWSAFAMGSDALRASDTLFSLIQGALPDNQWTIEVSTWMATSLARLQQLSVQYATGSPTVTDTTLMILPNSTEEKAMCRAQKVRNASGATSLSVLGIAIILVVGTILITLSLLLSVIVDHLRRRFSYKDHKRMQYSLDDKLQLHRLAYESAGQGNWSNCARTIPITRANELLGLPGNLDRDHPRLIGGSQQTPPKSQAIPNLSSVMDGKSYYVTFHSAPP